MAKEVKNILLLTLAASATGFLVFSFVFHSILMMSVLGLGLVSLAIFLWGRKGFLFGSLFILIFVIRDRESFMNIPLDIILFGLASYLFVVLITMRLRIVARDLKRSESQYRSLVERANDGILIIQDGVVKYGNPVLSNILGYDPEEAVGTDFREYLIEEEVPKVYKRYQERMKGGGVPAVYETILKHKSGGIVFVELSAGVINYRGKPADLVIIRDVTQRKQVEDILHQREQEFRILVESSPDVIARFDKEYRFIYANPAIELDFGTPQRDFFWKTLRESRIVSDRNAEVIEDTIGHVFETGKPRTIYIEQETPLGMKYYTTRFSPEYGKDNRIRTVLAVGRDITEVKEIDRTKSEFISISSHQLRTPLSIIRWCSMMLLDKHSGNLTGDQRSYLDKIYQSSRQLIRLANAFLNVAILDLGILSINPERIDFIEISDAILNELEDQIKEKKIRVRKSYPKKMLAVKADKRLVTLVFRGLLLNAVKYNDKKGDISIEIKKDKDNVLVKIGDSGCGIPEDAKPKIFSKFFRAENARNIEIYGTGLDLYIIKSIMKSCGGDIWFESPNPDLDSDVRRGTVFYFTLPLAGMKKRKGEESLNL